MFCGVLYFHKDKKGLSESASKLVRRACRYSHQKIEHLYQDDYFVLYNISRKNESSDSVISLKGHDSVNTWYTDITGAHLACRKEITSKLKAYKWDQPFNQRGQWIGARWNPKNFCLEFVTDFLGSVWLYFAKTDKGYLFAQDFSALSGHPDFRASVNEDNLLVELGMGYLPDDSTIFDDITIAPAGSVIRLSIQGIETVTRENPSYRGEYANLSQAEKFSFLDDQYETIYQQGIVNRIEETCISLSAGLDSRYAQALLQKNNDRCSAFTFGIENSDEVYGAARIAALADVRPTYFNFTDTSWSGWRRCIEQLGNIGIIQWVGWAEEWLQLLSANHQYVLIGYFGDALSGKHLVRSDPKEEWLKSWLDWSMDSWATSGFLREDYRSGIRGHIGARLEKIADGIDTVFPHQLAMHLDMYGRQRRWVASQPNLISKFLNPKTYFLSKELVNFWTNIPYSDLNGQRLYKEYAASRFPRFFDKNEGRVTLMSRIQRKILHQIARATQGEQTHRVSHVIERDRVIFQNLSAIRDLMDKSEHKLSHIMDYPKLHKLVGSLNVTESLTQKDAGIILRAVNLMILMDNQ